MNRADQREAARLLHAVLQAIERGDLAADGPAATAVAHRLEGAALALDRLLATPSRPRRGDQDTK